MPEYWIERDSIRGINRSSLLWRNYYAIRKDAVVRTAMAIDSTFENGRDKKRWLASSCTDCQVGYSSWNV